MNALRWVKKNPAVFISILSLFATVTIGLLTIKEIRRISISQVAVVAGISSQYSDNSLEDNELISLIICRTELYVSNRGGSEALIEVLESKITPDFFPEIEPPEVKLVSTLQHHLDIAALKASEVPMLVAFHNWGQEPPTLDKVVRFYKTSGLKILDDAKPTDELPAHLAYLGSPVVTETRIFGRESVLVIPSPVTTRGGLDSGFPFLDRRPDSVLLDGYKLSRTVLDNIILYKPKPDQQYLLNHLRNSAKGVNGLN